MAAEYPAGTYAPREKENKSGVVYDASKKTIGFAEDVVKLDEEVVAIEEELGTDPRGAKADVVTRLDDVDTEIAGKMANPMTTAEDLVIGGAGGTPTRLAKGANGKVLGVLAGVLAWVSAAATFLGLSDTPNDYSGQAGKAVLVKGSEDGVEFGVVGADVGGSYGINVETLSGDKTLTPDTDEIYQYLDEGGSNRIITLATAGAIAGDRFIIRHNGAYNDTKYLHIKQGATELDKIYAGAIKAFIFNGTNWVPVSTGTGENDNKKNNVTIGAFARGYTYGVAVGYYANGLTSGAAVGYASTAQNFGVGIGRNANGSSSGVAVGYASTGQSYGVAIGYYAHSGLQRYSVALGYYSRTNRVSEIAKNIDGSSTQDYNMSSAGWAKETVNATPVEMFLGERNNSRFKITAESVLSFVIRIAVRDNVANEVASYKIEGLIKRDNSNNTVLVWSDKTVEYEDDGSWDVAVTADDPNNSLIITVTGDATNPTRFVARIDEVELQY